MHQVQRLVQKICRGIGTPAAHALDRMVTAGEWTQAQSLKLAPPYTYASASSYRDDNLIVEFARKLAIPGDTAARKKAAVRTFYSAEAQCLKTNGRLRKLQIGTLELHDLRILEFITRWRANVRDTLGRIPLRLNPRYSPGSTLSDAGKSITIPDKMSSSPSCYAYSEDVAIHSCEGTELATLRKLKIADANRFFVVPKDSKTDRGCCVEASINVSLQLDVGAIIKERISARYKVDLKNAQRLHRMAAQMASVSGAYATVDLSNASDTVSRELVRLLLPSMWYDLLNSLRANKTTVEGKTVYLEKFSSMGNGYTFELETLIFHTLLDTLGVDLDDGLVYGDDIIVPIAKSTDLIAALTYFGFTPNQRKTFCEGPFRESCGGDFFLGHDVRAVYLKEMPDEPQKWVVLHNQLKRWDHACGRLRAARRYCIDQIPIDRRVFGPTVEGDAWLHDDEALPTRYNKKNASELGLTPGSLGFWGFEPVSTKILVSYRWFTPRVVIAAALLGCGERIALRDSVQGYRKVFTPVHGLNCNKTIGRLFPGLITWLGR